MKKILIKVLSCLLLLVLLLTACATKKDNVSSKEGISDKSDSSNDLTPVGEFPITKEPLTLSVGVLQDPNVEDFDTNAYTKWIEESTGIDIEFEYFPNKNATEKLSIMLNSNEKLPEVLIGFRLNTIDVARYGKQGYFLPLNDYYENYSVNINEFYSKHPELVKYFKSPDGNIYTVPQYTESTPNMFALRAWINQAWLDELGLDMPSTTEELQNVLQQFKSKDPNGNGLPDELPMVGSATTWYGQAESFIMNSFIYDDTKNKFIVNDNKVDVIYNKEEYKQGLTYMNELCENGLLSPLTFTQDKAQYKQMMVSGGKDNVVGVWVAGGIMFPSGDEKMKEYNPLPPISGPNGLQITTYNPSIPFPMAYITKDCKNVEAAFRMLDFMYNDEATMRARYGVPGTDWIEKEDGEIGMFEEVLGIEGKFKSIQFPWSEPIQNSHWKNTGLQFRTSDITDAIIPSGDPLESQYLVSRGTFVNYDYKPDDSMIVPLVLYNSDELDELGDLQTTLVDYVKESAARFITGDMDIDNQWDDYINNLNKIGLKKYLEITQQAWDRMNSQ